MRSKKLEVERSGHELASDACFRLLPSSFVLRVTVVVVMVLCLGCASAAWASHHSHRAKHRFERIVQQVTKSTARVYHARDSSGHGMDTAKIIMDPAGGYLAVSHTREGSSFHVNLASSSDLIEWTFQSDLGSDASQPYITSLSDGGFLVAWEQTPHNHLRFNYYASRDDLFAAQPSRTFDAPMTLSTCAEGTPSIYSAALEPDIDHSTIDVGAHYFSNCTADRQQRGTLTNFNSWSTSPQTDIDNAILFWGVQGNIGDRDATFFQHQQFGLFEGQFARNNFATWRIFCYDYKTGQADLLGIRTDQGSTAFANPSVTRVLAPNGEPAILVTLFLPSQGAKPGEAGELIYYKILERDHDDD